MIIATHVSVSQGHGGFPPTPSAGGDSFMTIDGHPMILVGQEFLPHTSGKNTHTPVVTGGSAILTEEGIAVAMVGSPLSCGDQIASSATTYATVEE